MKKLSVCVLFGGVSPEHEVSLRSAESVLNNLNPEKYNIFPVGITRDGQWILFGGSDYSMLPNGTWESCPRNRRAALSPVRGQGLLSFENDCVVRERIDVVFPVLHLSLIHIFGVVRAFVGHGVGAHLHEEPEVPNFGAPGRGPRMVKGMTLAVEPMVTEGTYEVRVLKDKWTTVTADGKLAAHYENSILITDGEPEILTVTEGL